MKEPLIDFVPGPISTSSHGTVCCKKQYCVQRGEIVTYTNIFKLCSTMTVHHDIINNNMFTSKNYTTRGMGIYFRPIFFSCRKYRTLIDTIQKPKVQCE